jgi:hypothetical protein
MKSYSNSVIFIYLNIIKISKKIKTVPLINVKCIQRRILLTIKKISIPWIKQKKSILKESTLFSNLIYNLLTYSIITNGTKILSCRNTTAGTRI